MEPGVNLRNKFDFLMFPENKKVERVKGTTA